MSIFIEKPNSLNNIDEEHSYVIAASAGTGKTYTLEHLVLDKIIEGGVEIEKILVVTFTRRATAEMKGRIRRLLESILDRNGIGDSDDDVEWSWEIDAEAVERVERALNDFDTATISTIHSFCQEIIGDYAFSCGKLFDAELVDESELFEECFYDVLRERLACDGAYKPWLEKALQKGVELDRLAKDLQKIWSRGAEVLPRDESGLPFGGASPSEIDKKWKLQTVCWKLFGAEIAGRIRTRKTERGLMSYDDLLITVRDEVRGDTGLVDLLRERFEVVLVDEFQDTDPVQWEIFQEVFLADKERELFVIGDEKQSIYSFRGADVGTYEVAIGDDRFRDKVALEHNYRSTDELIEAYNTLFDAEFFGNDENYSPVRPPPEESDKTERWFVDQAFGEEPIELFHLKGGAKKSTAESAFTARTADQIDELIGSTIERDGTARPLEPGDIYVLTRSNKEADKIGRALADRGVPHAFYRRSGLFETEHALDILRLLRAVARPTDGNLRRKAMITPFFAIRLDEIGEYEIGSDERAWTPRKQLESWHEMAARRDLTKLFDDIMERSGVIRRELLSTDSERRLTNYRHIFDWLLEEASKGHLGLEQLADLLQRHRDGTAGDSEEEDTDLQRLETDKSCVQIMTIHKSKGLEAEVVFVCGGFGQRDDVNYRRSLKIFTPEDEIDGSRRPLAFHKKAKSELPDGVWDEFSAVKAAESARLFYVAITRAVSKVYLPYISAEAGSWREKSELSVVFNALDNLCGGAIGALEQKDGFEISSFAVDDVETGPRAPRLVPPDALNLTGTDVERLVSARPSESPGGSRSFGQIRENQKRISASYSSLTDHGGDRGEAVEDSHANPLPKSKETGNALHEILEHLDYETAREMETAAQWVDSLDADSQPVKVLLDEILDSHGFDPERFREYTAQILFEALRAPLYVSDQSGTGDIEQISLPPLCEVDGRNTAREVRFVLPLPHQDAHSLGDDFPEGAAVKRGYFTGEIDLLFEDHKGRVYFADWKSDTRVGGESYERNILAKHVGAEYRTQAAVYTAALVRMLNITTEEQYEAKFGGLFYLFVRGMESDGDAGQFFERPSWSRVQQLGEQLRDNPPAQAIENWKTSHQKPEGIIS